METNNEKLSNTWGILENEIETQLDKEEVEGNREVGRNEEI